MVHALRTVHDLLAPGGFVLDVRPQTIDPDLGVAADGRVAWLGVLTETDDGVEYRLAEAAVAFAVASGRFEREAATSFLLHRYADSLAELRGYLARHWKDAVIADTTAGAIERAAATASGPSRIVIREHAQLARLRRC